MSNAVTAVGLTFIVLLFGSVYSAFTIVEEGDLKAILVFGEMKGVLQPGLNIVPPFVSKTYPIDPQTMQIVKDGSNVDVPDEFIDDVRDAR